MAVLTVGIGKQYRTIPAAIQAAQSGDTIQVDAGTYANQYATITKDLTLIGVGGMVKMTSTGLIPSGKGILVTNGNVTIKNFQFSGAKNANHNGAGIWHARGDLTLDNTGFFNNENGVITGNSGLGNVIVRNSEFGDNGYNSPAGQAHSLYVGRIQSLTVENSYFHGVKYGHEIKSRADTNLIQNSRIYDLNSTASYTIDLAEGGNATIRNNVIQQGPNSPNSVIISYGESGDLNPGTNFLITGNVIINDKPGNIIAVRNTTTNIARIIDNNFYGVTSSQIASGRNTQSGNVFLTVRPILDTSHPWVSVVSALSRTLPGPSNTLLAAALSADMGASATDTVASEPAIDGGGDADPPVMITQGSAALAATAASQGDDITASDYPPDAAPSLVMPKPILVLDAAAPATDDDASGPAPEAIGPGDIDVASGDGDASLGTTMADIDGDWGFAPDTEAGISTATDLAGNTGSMAVLLDLNPNLLWGSGSTT
jgi:hypothetical protein